VPVTVTSAGSLPARISGALQRRGRYDRWVLLVTLSGLFATTFPITVLTLSIPTIADDFGVDDADLAWVITLPTLASALALPLLGKLGDLYGHRRVFLTGFALATVATALTATATSAPLLIGWRTLTQVLGGATQPSSLALISTEYQPDRRAKAMGWWAMIAAGAPVIGLALGAPLIEAIGWQALFVLQAALMVVPVAASWLVLRETPRREARFDLAGALTLSVAVGALMIIVSQGPEWGFDHVAVLVSIVVAPIGLAAFVAIERRTRAPLLPLEFFRRRDFSASITASFFSSAAYMGAFFIASLLMLERFDYSLTGAVPILTVRPILFAACSPIGGRLAQRFGNRIVATIGCASLTAGLIGLAVGAAAKSLLIVVGVGFLFQGVGYGFLRPPISTALANSVAQRDLGVAAASERLMGQIGVAFGITTMAAVYAGDVDRFPAAFVVGAVLAAISAVVCLAMSRGQPGATAPSPATVALDETAYEETAMGVPVIVTPAAPDDDRA
jgi:EmrB/QacA subfamily drug resistance transporter